MKAAILGATRGMGRALARHMAERGDEVCVLGRRLGDAQASAADLTARHPTQFSVPAIICDLADPSCFDAALTEVRQHLGGLDVVVVTAGLFATQAELEADPALVANLLQTNFTNTILFCEAARKQLLAHGGGTLCVFSSVAGDRGRKPVAIYGASKAGLSYYLEALDHKYRAAGLVTICVKPGFVKTTMTQGLKPPPFSGEANTVARQVLAAIDHGTPEIYAPLPWRFVMGTIKHLPRAIMRRIEF